MKTNIQKLSKRRTSPLEKVTPYNEIIFCYDNFTKHRNALRSQNIQFLDVTAGCTLLPLFKRLLQTLVLLFIGVTWLITLRGQNRPQVQGTLIFERVKIERGGTLV
jgi:hypothetical protein